MAADQQYRKKPVVVRARRHEGDPVKVKTQHGEVVAKAGDWIVTGLRDSWPVSAADFAETYELADSGVALPVGAQLATTIEQGTGNYVWAKATLTLKGTGTAAGPVYTAHAYAADPVQAEDAAIARALRLANSANPAK